jgi:hypothetical protein
LPSQAYIMHLLTTTQCIQLSTPIHPTLDFGYQTWDFDVSARISPARQYLILTLLHSWGSAVSPSGNQLVTVNGLDGLDWFGLKKQVLLGITVFNIGGCWLVDVVLINKDTAIMGHPQGAVIIATYNQNILQVVQVIACLEVPDCKYYVTFINTMQLT